MLALIFGFLAKIGIGTIATKIASAYEARQNATTKQAEIAADERIKTLEARRDVMVAEGGSPINSFIRAGFALPFVLYNMKLVVWDKMLGLGATDGLSDELFQIELACIAFYFVYDTARVIARRK